MIGSPPGEIDQEEASVFSEINITPLTDIFLVLLIIFMVGASMAVDAAGSAGRGEAGAMSVELPQGAAQDLSPGQGDVAVIVLADGRVIWRGEEISDDSLVEVLRNAREAQEQASTLIVQADEGAHHGRVVAVMEMARAAGFSKLAVATRGD